MRAKIQIILFRLSLISLGTAIVGALLVTSLPLLGFSFGFFAVITSVVGINACIRRRQVPALIVCLIALAVTCYVMVSSPYVREELLHIPPAVEQAPAPVAKPITSVLKHEAP